MIGRVGDIRVDAARSEVGELTPARVPGAADRVRLRVEAAAIERITAREARVRVETELRRGGGVGDRHPFTRQHRLGVPVHHSPVAQIGDVLRTDVADRDRRLVEVGRDCRGVIVVLDAQRVAGTGDISDVRRDHDCRRRRHQAHGRQVRPADRLVGIPGQAARRVRDAPTLAQAAVGRAVGVEGDIGQAHDRVDRTARVPGGRTAVFRSPHFVTPICTVPLETSAPFEVAADATPGHINSRTAPSAASHAKQRCIDPSFPRADPNGRTGYG